MAHLRLLLVFAVIGGLGYFAYREGWVRIAAQGVPAAQPTLGFTIHESRHRRLAHENLGRELARQWQQGRRFRPKSSATQLAAIAHGANALEIPAVPSPAASAVAPVLPFPKSFEGCWQATVTEPESWTFGRGPVVKGISPSTYVLCFRYSGKSPEVTFSTTAQYPVVSDWVESNVGVENERTDILYSGDNFVILRTASSTPLHMKILGVLPGPTGIIKSRTDFHCTHLSDDKLLVEASTVQRCVDAHSIDCDGDVWIKESWHTKFTRQ